MSHLSRVLDLLPPPYTVEPDSVLSSLLDRVALEMDAFQEDLDRYQRSHWIRAAYRLGDAARIGALVGVAPLPWEDLELFRDRLLPLVAALLAGATGPGQIRQLVFDYLSRAEASVGATFVPGLSRLASVADAFGAPADRPRYRPLALVENPEVRRRSGALLSVGGDVPYLYRWRESNKGLDETVAEFAVTGVRDRTAVPILVNLTTGELLGYAGELRFGQTLEIGPADAPDARATGAAAASVDGGDATARLFSLAGFVPGVPFSPDRYDPAPRLPRMARGANDWLFLSVGLYDLPGLDRVHFALADADLREGAFDQTTFDHALFPAGTMARLEMSWVETEPASFQVTVPRYVVIEPAGRPGGPVWAHLEEGLRDAIGRLHAAGVKATVAFAPFVETQPQQDRLRLPIKRLDPETGPAGRGDTVAVAGRFGESPLGSARFD